ncbi:ATP-dependent helicase HRQ1, partial [Neolecta irregularis DAH-3]
MVGFPPTISAMRQQSGRAGRRNKDSLAILVAEPGAVDQHYMNHPDQLFTSPNTHLVIDLENPLILEGHLQCAAFEMPIRTDVDKFYFGDTIQRLVCDSLVLGDKIFHPHPRFLPFPSRHVAIRDCQDGHYTIIDITNNRNHILEQIEPSRAMFTLYQGPHPFGYPFILRNLDTLLKIAQVESTNVDWTTRHRSFTDVEPIETEATKHLANSSRIVSFGRVKITCHVSGYFKLDKRNNILDTIEIDNPPLIIETKGLWIDIPKHALDTLVLKKTSLEN